MARQRVGTGGKVEFEWETATVQKWAHDLSGPLAHELMARLAETVLRGAKRRALRRQGPPTSPAGHMADQMYFDLIETEQGVAARIISPATDPRSHNFPYPIVHEGRKVRDRRAHRSLRPALRDIRHSVLVDHYTDNEGAL